MTITREELLKRKEALLSDYNAIGGALQDVDFWLAYLDKPVMSVEEPPVDQPPSA